MTEKYMGFWDHFAELRKRMKYSALVFALGVFGFYAVTGYLLKFMTGHFLSSYSAVKLLAATPMVGFMTRIKFALILALVITIPFLIYEMFMFVNPALKKKHSFLFLKVWFSSMFLFACGVAFIYFILIPLMLKFFIEYNTKLGLTNFFALDTFFSFIILTLFIGGIMFQVPLILILANRLGILKKSLLSHGRKWVYLFILIIAGVVTPDHTVISQLALGGVLVVLFEISLLFCKKDVPSPFAA
jgi:sec-independent protein translocase protein TatC